MLYFELRLKIFLFKIQNSCNKKKCNVATHLYEQIDCETSVNNRTEKKVNAKKNPYSSFADQKFDQPF
jgi:hypothetical protein